MHIGSKPKLSRVAVGMLALLVAVQVLPPFFGLHSPFGVATGLEAQNNPTACEAFGPNWTNCGNAFTSDNSYADANNLPGGFSPATVVDLNAATATATEQSRKVFKNPRGLDNYYVFYLDDADTLIKYAYSADGASWTSGNAAALITLDMVTGDESSWATTIYDDGSQLHVYLVYEDDTNARLRYRHGTIADAAATITWASESQFGGFSQEAHGVSLAISSNGRLFVAWVDERTAGAEVMRVFGWDVIPAGDAVSGSADGITESDRLITTANPTGTANEINVIYQEGTTILNAVKVTDTGGGPTFGTKTTLTGLTLTRGVISAATDTQATTETHVAYRNGAAVEHRTYNEASGFSGATSVLASTPDSVSLAMDETSTPDEVFVFYLKSGVAGDVFFKSSPVDTISFGGESRIDDDSESIDYLSASMKDWGADSKIPLAYTTQSTFLARFVNVGDVGPGFPGKNDTAWRDFGFSFDPSDTIDTVEIGVEWFRTSSAPVLNVTISWDGGSSWATNQTATNKSADDDTPEFLDFTSATAWTISKLSDANLRVRVGTNASDARLDHVTMRVNYNVAPLISNFRIQQVGSVQVQRDPTACEAVGDNWTTCQDAFSSNDLYAYANGSAAGGDPITFIDWTEQSISGTSLTVTVPTHLDGDTLITVLVHSDDAPSVTITPPGGWNLVRDKTNMGTLAVSPPVLYIYEREASSEPASYIWSWDLTGGLLGVMLSYRGTDAASPIGQNAVNAQTGTGTDAVAPSVTTTNDNELALWIGWSDDDDGNDPSATLGRGTVRAREMTSAGGNGAFVGIGDENIPSPGATGTATWTLTAVEERAGVTITLLPAASVGGNDTAWKDFGFALGGADSITTVEIGLEWFRNNTAPALTVTISWDGGATWAATQIATNKSADDDVVQFLDFTSATTWTASKLNDTNLRARASTNASGGRLDYTTVRVTSIPSRAGTQLDVDTEYEYLFNVTDADGWSDIASDGNIFLNLWYDGGGTPSTDQRDPTACTAVGNDWTNCQDAFSSNDVYAYANASAGGGGAFTYITPVEVTPGTASAWVDVDVSAYVPSGATGVILHVVNNAGGDVNYGFRKPPSSDNRLEFTYPNTHLWAMIGINDSRIFQTNIGDITGMDLWLSGYTNSGVTFFANAVDKSLSTTGAWTDIDISADTGADTAVGAIIEIDGEWTEDYGLRMKGSSDNRVAHGRHVWAIVGVDEAEVLQGYITATTIDFFVVGYVTSGATFFTNAINKSLTSTGSWLDIDISGDTGGDTASGAFIEVNAPSSLDYGLRENGSTENIVNRSAWSNWGIVEVDGTETLEGQIADLSVDFYLVGYSHPELGGALAFDSASNSSGSGTSLTWTHTTSGTDRLLIVGVSRQPTVTTQTIYSTAVSTTFQVPAGVTSITVKIWGAGGGGGGAEAADGGAGGGGGYTYAVISVTPGETLDIVIGGGGSGAAGNGGGTGGDGGGGGPPVAGGGAGAGATATMGGGGGGGGYAAVLRSGTLLVIGAGGGGGGGGGNAGSEVGGVGGAGGGSTGDSGGLGQALSVATGGTQSGGGTGGTAGTGGNGADGSLNAGGDGGNNGGGGGGSGQYGGGGGGGDDDGAGGGGGGSSLGDILIAGSGTTAGNSSDPDYAGSAGQGGAGGAATDGDGGGGNPGRIVLTYELAIATDNVSYNGVLLTELVNHTEAGDSAQVELWYLLDPPTGTHNIVVNQSNAGAIVGGATTWTGVDQASPLGPTAVADGTTDTATVDVISASNEVVVDVVAALDSTSPSVGALQSERWNLAVGAVDGGGSSEGGAGTVTMNWTLSGATGWAIAGVSLNPSLTAGNDFKIQRGQVTIPTSAATVTITAGTDYTAPSSLSKSFIRIVGTRLSASGDDVTGSGGAQPAQEWMTSISNPGNLLTSITFERYLASTGDTTRIYWEILEYTGPNGGANEFIVRDQAEIEQSSGTQINGTSATVTDDADVVVFITGQRNNGGNSGDTFISLYTSEWVSSTNIPRFTRATDETIVASVSYAVVEFTGSNWKVQRAERTYLDSTSEETEIITAVVLARTFIHAQMRTASGNVDEMGQRVYLNTTTTVSFQLRSGAHISSQVGVAWVVENTQTGGSAMNVQRVSGTQTGGGAPNEWTETITAVADLSTTSIMGETADSSGTGNSGPRGAHGLNLTDTSTVTLWRADGNNMQDYRFEVVEWPTAAGGGGGDPGTNDTAWRDFGFALSGSITQVEVGVEWFRNNTAPILDVSISWDGGASWATDQTATNKSADDDTVEWLDFTSATAWTPTKLNDANFRVRVGTNASGARLDYVTVRVGSISGGELTFSQQTTGANYRIVLTYQDTADPTTASLSEWSVTEGRATYNASASGLTAILDGPTIIGYEFRLALKFGFQVKHAVAPTNSTVGAYNDLDSWNGEVVATDGPHTITLQEASTGEHMEFGVFKYTFVNISGDWTVNVNHGSTANTNTVTVYRRSNDDFTLRIWFVTDLIKGGDTIPITNVQILAAGDLTDDITADTPFAGLGEGNAVYILGSATLWFSHSTGTDEDTTTVQFSVTVALGTPLGTYTAELTIRIQQQP